MLRRHLGVPGNYSICWNNVIGLLIRVNGDELVKWYPYCLLGKASMHTILYNVTQVPWKAAADEGQNNTRKHISDGVGKHCSSAPEHSSASLHLAP